MVFALGVVLNLTYHRYGININAKKSNPKPECLRQLFFFATIAMHWLWLVMGKVRKVTFYERHMHTHTHKTFVLMLTYKIRFISAQQKNQLESTVNWISCKCCPWILRIIYDKEKWKKNDNKLRSISSNDIKNQRIIVPIGTTIFPWNSYVY